MDNYTAAKFSSAFEQPYPEDHPRCDECSEPLSDREIQHSGDWSLCDNCGTVCDCCDLKHWNEDIQDGTEFHEDVEHVCANCIEHLAPEEIEPCWIPAPVNPKPSTERTQ